MKKGWMLSLEESPYHDGIGLRGAQIKIAFVRPALFMEAPSKWALSYHCCLGWRKPILTTMAETIRLVRKPVDYLS